MTDFEAIIVNDGSTDNSLQLLNNLIKNDERFKILSIKNHGQNFARKYGVSRAKGKFVTFIDGDDFIDSVHLKCMYEKIIASDAEVVFCNYYVDVVNGDSSIGINSVALRSRMSMQSNITLWISNDIPGFFWNKMFRSDSLRKCHFDMTVNYMEDVRTISSNEDLINMMVFSELPTYHYVQREGSAVNRVAGIDEFSAILLTSQQLIHICVQDIDFYNLSKRIIGLLWYSVTRINYCQLDEIRPLVKEIIRTIRTSSAKLDVKTNIRRFIIELAISSRVTLKCFLLVKGKYKK